MESRDTVVGTLEYGPPIGKTKDAMVTVQTIKEIRELAASMLETPEEERILIYRQLNRHFLTLEASLQAPSHAPANALLDRLKVHLIALARLDDPDQVSDEQHMKEAMEAIDALSSLLAARRR